MHTRHDQRIKLRVTESPKRDVGRALGRMDPADLARLGVKLGDSVELIGSRRALGKAMPAHHEFRGQSRVQLDGVLRDNVGAAIDDVIEVRAIMAQPAERVVLSSNSSAFKQRDMPYLGRLLDGLPQGRGWLPPAWAIHKRPAEAPSPATTRLHWPATARR